jgi:hypothetical protein
VVAIRSFLIKQGVRTGSILVDKAGDPHTAFRVEISSIRDVLLVAKKMLPNCVKKSHDLMILIDYLEGKATGDQTISRYNNEVLSGRRSGIIRDSNLPFTRDEGVRVSKLENAMKARAAHSVVLDKLLEEAIRIDRRTGLSRVKLARKYHLSESVIRRVLRQA